MVIGQNNDCATESKLTITGKALSNYNDRSSEATSQPNKKTDLETQKHLD